MDLAKIGYAVDTSGLARGELALDSFQKANDDVAASAARAQAAASRTATGMGAMAPAAQGLAKATALASWEVTNLTRQMFDVGVSLASGQSFLMVGIQQGAQMAEIMGSRGVRGALAGVAQGITALISPTTIALGAITVAGYAVSEIWKSMRDDILDLDGALEKHEKTLKVLAGTYGDAGKGALTYVGQARAVSEFMEKMARDQLRDRLNNDLNKLLLTEMQAPAQRTPIGDLFSDIGLPEETVSEKYRAFTKEIETLRDQLRAGVPDVLGFQAALVNIAKSDLATSEIRKAANAAIEMTNGFAQAQRQIEATIAALGRFGNAFDEAGVGAEKAPDYLGAEMERRGKLATMNIDARKEAEGLVRGAEAGLSNAGLTDYARGLAEIGQRYAELRRQAQEAGTLGIAGGFLDRAEAAELAAAAKTVETAWAQAIEEYGRTTEAMAGEAALWGRSTYEIERYKAILELTTLARQNDGVVTEAEIAMIRQEASARADLTSKRQARGVLNDIQFEREQLSRTSAEQRVYNELKAAGVSAESEFGQQIRASVVELEAAREAQKQIISGMDDMRSATSSVISGLVQGQDVTKMLAGRLANFGADKLTDALLGPSGKAGGGIFGDAMASLLGGGKPMSVATAQITAATVVVNGGVGSSMPSAVAGLAANGNAPGGSSTEIAANLLREREGYRSTPYWDVNAYRVGYGSDTTTDPTTGAVSRVTSGMSIDRMMAEADLARRIAETQTGIRGQVGAGAWDALNPGTQGALTSVGYNYGSLPQRVIPAVQSGDQNAIATAIEGLSGDNGGINSSRRMLEAEMVRQSQALGQLGEAATTATSSVGEFGGGVASVASALTGGGGATAAGGSGGGLLGSILSGIGGLFSGGLANGGHIPAGRWGIVGERGPETAFGGRTGLSVVPNGGGGGSKVNVQVIDQRSRGADVERQETTGPDGEKLVRLIVRDEVKAGFRDKGYIGKNLAARGAQRIPAMR